MAYFLVSKQMNSFLLKTGSCWSPWSKKYELHYLKQQNDKRLRTHYFTFDETARDIKLLKLDMKKYITFPHVRFHDDNTSPNSALWLHANYFFIKIYPPKNKNFSYEIVSNLALIIINFNRQQNNWKQTKLQKQSYFSLYIYHLTWFQIYNLLTGKPNNRSFIIWYFL